MQDDIEQAFDENLAADRKIAMNSAAAQIMDLAKTMKDVQGQLDSLQASLTERLDAIRRTLGTRP